MKGIRIFIKAADPSSNRCIQVQRKGEGCEIPEESIVRETFLLVVPRFVINKLKSAVHMV